MARITNRQKRVFIFASVPHPDAPTDETRKFPAVVANPGETVSVPDEHLTLLRKHSAQIFDHLFDGRHLEHAQGSGSQLRADELANPALPVAPDELDLSEQIADNVTLDRKGVDVTTVELPDDAPPAEAKPTNRRRA